jgi:FtsH-binding integral membrane protein
MMNENSPNPYAVTPGGSAAIYAEDSERIGFIRRTYAHLTGAILALIALETVLFATVPANTMEAMVEKMLSGWGWLLVLGAFMAVSWVARMWASSGSSRTVQYAGLGLYVVAQAVILLPLMYMAIRLDPMIPMTAALITAITFVGLSVFVMTTRVDLDGWGKYLALAGLAGMGLIVASIVTGGFSIGILLSGFFVALACGYILYDTSNVLHHYDTNQYVAASLALFSSVVLLFWYVLRIVMMYANND